MKSNFRNDVTLLPQYHHPFCLLTPGPICLTVQALELHGLTHLISTQTCVALAFQVWGLILHESCLVHTHFLLVTCAGTLWSGPPVVYSFFKAVYELCMRASLRALTFYEKS